MGRHTTRPEKRTGGAFGRRIVEPAERDERDAFRAHVTAAVSSVWSYDEIRAFGAKAQRDRERYAEILELFDEAAGGGDDASRLEDALFDAHAWKRARKRERYAEVRKLDPATFRRLREQAKVRYERWLARHPRPKQAKLTKAQARDIRRAYQTGLFQVDLAAIYGVSPSTIHLVLKGRTWKSAGGPTIERASLTHRRAPLVVDVASKRERKRASQAAWRARNPGYHAAKERERRERDPEAQRAKERAWYARRSTRT